MDNLAAVYDFVILIVSVSVFSTGFLSVRIHAALDRAIDRAEALDAHMQENLPRSSLSSASHVPAAVQRVRDIAKPDFVNRITLFGNAALLIILLLLWAVIGLKSEWHFTPRLSEWPFTLGLSEVAAGFWGLLAAAVVESGVISLRFLENYYIAKRAREFLNQSVAARFICAEHAFSRSN